jgi:hypothetical protein
MRFGQYRHSCRVDITHKKLRKCIVVCATNLLPRYKKAKRPSVYNKTAQRINPSLVIY